MLELGLLESGPVHFALAMFKHSTIKKKGIPITINSVQSAQQFKTFTLRFITKYIRSLSHKNGNCCLRDTAQDLVSTKLELRET